jgi:hypothetical protein
VQFHVTTHLLPPSNHLVRFPTARIFSTTRRRGLWSLSSAFLGISCFSIESRPSDFHRRSCIYTPGRPDLEFLEQVRPLSAASASRKFAHPRPFSPSHVSYREAVSPNTVWFYLLKTFSDPSDVLMLCRLWPTQFHLPIALPITGHLSIPNTETTTFTIDGSHNLH